MVQSSCSVKNGKLNEMIEVSALWSNTSFYCKARGMRIFCDR